MASSCFIRSFHEETGPACSTGRKEFQPVLPLPLPHPATPGTLEPASPWHPRSHRRLPAREQTLHNPPSGSTIFSSTHSRLSQMLEEEFPDKSRSHGCKAAAWSTLENITAQPRKERRRRVIVKHGTQFYILRTAHPFSFTWNDISPADAVLPLTRVNKGKQANTADYQSG